MNAQFVRRHNAIAHSAWMNFNDFNSQDEPIILSSATYPVSTRTQIYYIAIRSKKIHKGGKRKISEIVDIREKRLKEYVSDYYSGTEWKKPCKNMFRHLSTNDPEMLVSIIKYGNLRDTLMTFALEELGRSPKSKSIFDILVKFLDNEDSLIREGAVYGLSNYLGDREINAKLSFMSVHDPSRGVREAIEEILQG